MQARASGVLLPVFSLPGPYGVGTFGTPAREFVDFLAAGGQKFWQILPLVPPGGGNSPYMSPSSFAGNPLFLDLDELAEEGLLTAEELDSARRDNHDRVDYPWLLETRIPLLRKAWARGRARYARELAEFLEAERSWLPDYALFLALRDKFGGKPLADWPDELRLRKQPALENARAELKEACDFHAFLQLLFFRQWTAVKAYANGKGISIIGDLPIYVSPDSAEVWARPELFQLKEDMTPAGVAGVPPTPSPTRASTGATPSTTGTTTGRPALLGGAAGRFTWPGCMTWCASTTSGAFTPTGASPTGRRTPGRGTGKRAPAWSWWRCCAPSPGWR